MPNNYVDDAFIAEVSRIIKKVDGAKFADGMGGQNTPTSMVIGPAHGPAAAANVRADPTVLVKITAVNVSDPSGKYTGKLQVGAVDNKTTNTVRAGLQDGLDCDVWNLWEALYPGTAAHSIPTNTGPYMGIVAGSNSATGKLIVHVFALPPGITFAATISSDGGSAGSTSGPSSWTYTCKTLDGSVTLGTGVTPSRTRPTGNYSAGNYGICCYSASGAFLLIDAGETLNVTTC